jgi:hypothetical protein
MLIWWLAIWSMGKLRDGNAVDALRSYRAVDFRQDFRQDLASLLRAFGRCLKVIGYLLLWAVIAAVGIGAVGCAVYWVAQWNQIAWLTAAVVYVGWQIGRKRSAG